jgi:hypothetical protein
MVRFSETDIGAMRVTVRPAPFADLDAAQAWINGQLHRAR